MMIIHHTRVMEYAHGITDIRGGGSKPVHEEREDDREGPLTSEHCRRDTCDLGNFQHT